MQYVCVTSRIHHGDRGLRCDVETIEIGMGFEQLPGLVVGFRVHIVILDGRDKLDLRIKRLQGPLEGGSFFEMLDNSQIAEGDGYLTGPMQKLTSQVSGKRATDHGID